jgi:hypothetical protein
LNDLLELVVEPLAAAPRSDFAARFGFRKKPDYVRLRMLDGPLPGGFSELTVRADELAAPPARQIIVVENEVTYLALPRVARSVAIFGGGYGVAVLDRLPWLSEADLVYWGDIDTHGLVMLDRVRRRWPHVRSILMDRDTLVAHRIHWVREPMPAREALDALTPEESALYRDLVEDVYGSAVRLEQERVRFSRVKQALSTL